MSDKVYPSEVVVDFNGNKYHGCGWKFGEVVWHSGLENEVFKLDGQKISFKNGQYCMDYSPYGKHEEIQCPDCTILYSIENIYQNSLAGEKDEFWVEIDWCSGNSYGTHFILVRYSKDRMSVLKHQSY